MSTFYTPAILLKKTDRAEADQLFSIYTRHRGKVIAVGRGSKKISSKLNGHVQPFAIMNVMVAPGKASDHLAGVEIVTHFSSIRDNFRKIIIASYALELVDKFTKPGQTDIRIFELLEEYLKTVDEHECSAEEWQALRRSFVTALLNELGFNPTQQALASDRSLEQFLEGHLEVEIKTNRFLRKMFA